MPLWTPLSHATGRVDNWGVNPSITPGTSVIPGVSGAEGSWTQVLSTLADEVYMLLVHVLGGATSGQTKLHVMDIGIDPAGGSSYTAIISDIVCGASSGIESPGDIGPTGGFQFLFPIRLPAGATVAVRIAGGNATAGTVRVAVRAFAIQNAPWMFPCGQYSETIGVSGTSGTGFTPGNAADGTWVSLGTTTRELWWWQLCYQISNTTMFGRYTYIDLAYGDVSNKHLIMRLMGSSTTSEASSTTLSENFIPYAAYCRVPAGSTIYVRGRCNLAPGSGYEAAAVGIGG